MASNYAQLLDLVASRRALLVESTQKLVAAASPNPPGDVTQAATVAAELIRQSIPSSQISLHETGPGILNVVARISGKGAGRRLIFNGHLDTYPTGDEKLWTHAPFSGEVSADDRRLYGRGASDMKGGIVASIVAASILADQRHIWDGEIVLTLAGDEETMGSLGSKYLLDTVDCARGDAMVCGDAGSPRVVRIGEKGLVWVEITAKGQSAHGAHVHKGINAIDRLRSAMDALKTLEQRSRPCPSDIVELIKAAAPLSEPISGAGESDTLQRTTVNIGVVSGGVSPNLIPASAHCLADVRLPVGTLAQDVVDDLHDLLDNIEGISFRVLQAYDPTSTPPTAEIVNLALKASRSVLGGDVAANVRVGASDARLYRAAGIPSVVVGLTPYNMGGPDESIEIDELVQVAQIHTLIAADFLFGR